MKLNLPQMLDEASQEALMLPVRGNFTFAVSILQRQPNSYVLGLAPLANSFHCTPCSYLLVISISLTISPRPVLYLSLSFLLW